MNCKTNCPLVLFIQNPAALQAHIHRSRCHRPALIRHLFLANHTHDGPNDVKHEPRGGSSLNTGWGRPALHSVSRAWRPLPPSPEKERNKTKTPVSRPHTSTLGGKKKSWLLCALLLFGWIEGKFAESVLSLLPAPSYQFNSIQVQCVVLVLIYNIFMFVKA